MAFKTLDGIPGLDESSDDEDLAGLVSDSDSDGFLVNIEKQWNKVAPARRVSTKTCDPYVLPSKRQRRELSRRSSDVAGEYMGINGLELRRLLRMCVPIAFLNIMTSLLRDDFVPRDLDCSVV